MASITYRCGTCGQERERDQLVVVRKQFATMGTNSKVLKTRVIKWVCTVPRRDEMIKTCLDVEPGYLNAAYDDAPGTAAKRSSTA